MVFSFCCFFLFFPHRISFCYSQTVLKLVAILLSQPPGCYEYRLFHTMPSTCSNHITAVVASTISCPTFIALGRGLRYTRQVLCGWVPAPCSCKVLRASVGTEQSALSGPPSGNINWHSYFERVFAVDSHTSCISLSANSSYRRKASWALEDVHAKGFSSSRHSSSTVVMSGWRCDIYCPVGEVRRQERPFQRKCINITPTT